MIGPAAINGPTAWNRNRADANEPAKDAANHGSARGACGSALRSFGGFYMSEIFAAFILRKEDGNVFSSETVITQRLDALLDVIPS